MIRRIWRRRVARRVRQIGFTLRAFASQSSVILVAAVQPKCGLTQLEYRWAIGLFLYQTFDAIDGCVPSIQIVMA